MFKHTFDSTILRSYDIRGIYGKTLTDKDALMLGFFFGITVREKNPNSHSKIWKDSTSKIIQHISEVGFH